MTGLISHFFRRPWLGLVAGVVTISGGGIMGSVAQPLPPLPVATPSPEATVEPGNLTMPQEIVNQRVTSELLQLCGGPRCPQATVVVRLPLELTDTYAQAITKLERQVLSEVQTSFQRDPNLQRVIVDGYIYRGPGNFVDTEFPVMTLFVSRYLWRTGNYSIDQNSLRYPEGLRQLAAIAAPEATPEPTPPPPSADTLPPVPAPATVPEAPPPDAAAPPLPQLPPEEDPNAPL
ncbi:MAG: hypothetical protein OHK0012_12790 [Synechococcales cyanobacterium]